MLFINVPVYSHISRMYISPCQQRGTAKSERGRRKSTCKTETMFLWQGNLQTLTHLLPKMTVTLASFTHSGNGWAELYQCRVGAGKSTVRKLSVRGGTCWLTGEEWGLAIMSYEDWLKKQGGKGPHGEGKIGSKRVRASGCPSRESPWRFWFLSYYFKIHLFLHICQISGSSLFLLWWILPASSRVWERFSGGVWWEAV